MPPKSSLLPLTFFHRRYGIKKHWASSTHYDLRLEWNGKLLSWALPMGPTRTPGIMRKAIQMPNHRPENLDFEGIHESGTIMFWDRGTWVLHPEFEDVENSLEQGVLKFRLHGEKLEGWWTLHRTSENQHGKAIWLLNKDNGDDFCIADFDNMLDERPNSIKTGRTREQIELDWSGRTKESENQALLF